MASSSSSSLDDTRSVPVIRGGSPERNGRGEAVPGRLTTGAGDTPGRLGRLGTPSPLPLFNR